MVENVLGIDIGGTSIKLGVVCGEEVLESTSLRNTFKGKSNLLVEGIKEICDGIMYIFYWLVCTNGTKVFYQFFL